MTATGAPDPPAAVAALGRVAVHPVLVAAWPALTLWGVNVHEVLPGDVWPVMVVPVVAAAVVWGVAALGMRSARRGALTATAAAVVVLNAGRITGGAPATWAVWVAAGLLVAAVVGAVLLRSAGLRSATAVANVLGVVLVLASLPPILSAWGPGGGEVVVPEELAGAGGLAGRDIWYIIPDRYPRADTLQAEFGFDNGPFLDRLEAWGFQVAEDSLANYPKTAHSLAVTWNLAPLDELIPDPPADGSDWQPIYTLLREHRLGQLLTDVGYEYIHLATWWSPTSTADSADRVLRADTHSEFQSVWEAQTLLPALRRAEEEAREQPSLRERNRRHSAFQLDQLDRLASTPHDRPRFVLAHITLPHEPYVFDADGGLLTQAEAAARSREENIAGQVQFVNMRLEALFERLLDGPPETWPVIVLQSDEGPHPAERTGPSYDWTTAPTQVVEEKLRTISAILLPGSDVELPEDLTGVDTFRYVLDETIGTDLGPVDDPPVEVFRGEDHLYDLHDVSDRVD